MVLKETWVKDDEDHPGEHNRLSKRINRWLFAEEFPSLQHAVDKAAQVGGTVLLQSRFTLSAPLVLPRTGATPDKVVHLKATRYGAGLQGTVNFPPGRALIEWATTPERALEQRIEGVQFWLPDIAGVKAIHYALTAPGTKAVMNAEHIQLDLADLRIYANNAYHDSLIRIEGLWQQSRITNVVGDPTGTAGGVGALLLDVDSTYSDGTWTPNNDSPGMWSCMLEGLYCGSRRGGLGRVFRGRLAASSLTRAFHNGSVGGMGFEFIHCENTTARQIGTEGRAEQPASIVLRECLTMRLQDSSPGTPDPVVGVEGGDQLGDGIALIGCVGCEIDGRSAYAGKPSFGDKGSRVLTMDADCQHNTATRFGVRPGVGGIDAEFAIAAPASAGNRIAYLDVVNAVAGEVTGA